MDAGEHRDHRENRQRREPAEPAEPRDSRDPPAPVAWRIDCDDCAMQGTDTCADCIVTFLCTRDDQGATVIDVSEVRALRLLHAGGLAPALRWVR